MEQRTDMIQQAQSGIRGKGKKGVGRRTCLAAIGLDQGERKPVLGQGDRDAGDGCHSGGWTRGGWACRRAWLG